MDILNYTKEHVKYRLRIQEFVKQEILPEVDKWEENRIMPKSMWKRLGQEGFLCNTILPEYGGPGRDFLYDVIVAEELVKSNHNGAGPSTHSDIVVPYINSFGCEKVKKKYLPGCVSGDIVTAIAMTEPDAGSDAASIKATAEEKGDEVIINGSKIFITNGINCDLAVVSARDPLADNPYEAISLYLVEIGSPGFEKGKKLDKLGMHSQDTSELFFSNCRIPLENRLGEKGKGFYMLMQKLQQERLITSLWAVVSAEYVLSQTLEHFQTNAGKGKMVANSQANQFTLVDVATDVKLGRLFLDKLIADHMEAKDIVVETSMAKFWTTEMVRRISDKCLDLYGDMAIMDSVSAVRYWKDARAMSIFAGTNEIMRKIVAKFMKI